MKQLLQNVKDGKPEIVDIPIPALKPGYLLVRNKASVVSSGTERMVVEFAEKNILMKAKSRPDLVKQVIDKAQREGIVPTIKTALNRLDTPMALGYSSAGEIVSIGDDVEDFKIGDRVACAGSGFACHAEFVLIPKNLISKIPQSVSFEEAAFSTIGAISLHGFRLGNPQIGEKVAIIGLGLLGLMMIDICKAAGLQVFGIDLDPDRVELARIRGVPAVHNDQALSQGVSFTHNRGFDQVFICADTSSNDPVELAGSISRDRGTVVAVGAVGLEIPRKIYYEKEIKFLISRSYGPGRYDNQYEEEGQDYPFGYIRWTEGRNLDAILDLIEANKLDVNSLISHRYDISNGIQAYETITGKKNEKFLGVIIKYPDDSKDGWQQKRVEIKDKKNYRTDGNIKVGVLGAGLYASSVFLPVINQDRSIQKFGICSAKGLSASQLAKKYHYQFACTDEQEILVNKDINTVVILTRHNDHARQTIESLKSNKHVYCEKPLALTIDELRQIKKTYKENESKLMVGFNRRFSSFIQKTKKYVDNINEPKVLHYRVNAGFIPSNHWIHDLEVGGGRIIGEGCHFIDLCIFLVGSSLKSIQSVGVPNLGKYHNDVVVITLIFDDGSIATIEYLANGDKLVEKETLEIFAGGSVVQLIDFKKLAFISNGRKETHNLQMSQDKGHKNAFQAFVRSIKSGSEEPISFDEMLISSLATIAAYESLINQEIIDFPVFQQSLI